MRGSRHRWLVTLALLALGCAADPYALEGRGGALEVARTYVEDPGARRAALEASVAVADTPYADLRLAHYGESWEAWPEESFVVRPFRVEGHERDDAPSAIAPSLPSDFADLGAWERAGLDVFTRYPAQIDLALEVLRDRDEAERAGLSVRDDGSVLGMIEVMTPSGPIPALTCAACHARVTDEGEPLLGVPNERVRMIASGHAWAAGTIDVTSDGIENPVRPSDLRPISLQARMHHAGNLANGRLARMVRIETLITTQRQGRARPDRRLVAALSLYLDALARTLPELDAASEGARAFASSCGGCHRGEALAGEPVPVALVGTDPAATLLGSERGTGSYRVPSLRGVGDRRGLFHDGSARDLDEVLGLSPTSRSGHLFGLTQSEPTRRAIAAYLRAERGAP